MSKFLLPSIPSFIRFCNNKLWFKHGGLVLSHLLSSFIFICAFLGNNDVSGLNCEYLVADIARHVGLHELDYFFYDFPNDVKFFLKVFMNISCFDL